MYPALMMAFADEARIFEESGAPPNLAAAPAAEMMKSFVLSK
jgi:hypothetical protein